LAAVRTGGTPGAAEYRHALRDVVTHCIHGVDRNPMALELARMSLWLETYTPDRALGFLDHHLVGGDALLGLLDLHALKDGIPDEAFRPLTGDDRAVARTLAKLNRAGLKQLVKRKRGEQVEAALRLAGLDDAFDRLDELDDDRLEAVEAKRQRFASVRAQAAESAGALAADLFLGAFLMQKRLAPGEQALTESAAAGRFPTTGTLLLALDGALHPQHSVAVAARRACRDASVLHWPLAFPQVFARGGFDVVLGNPPWERIKLQEQEFFATRDVSIAGARNKAERERLIRRLEAAPEHTPERRLFEVFVDAKHSAEAASVFCHTEARYPLTGVGDVNTYALFAETGYRLTSPAGRAGLVLPTGIATDDSTKRFFGDVVLAKRLVSLYDFENREAVFPGVHRSYKFCLFTIGRAEAAEFAFFLAQVHQLSDERRRFELTPEDFRLINPNTLTCPVFRSRADAELTKKIYRNVPVLIDGTKPPEEGNPWGLSFMAMFHMSNDSGLFRDEPFEGGLPLYEAKMIHQFDHRWATYEVNGGGRDAPATRDARDVEKADSGFSARPRYWVPREQVRAKLQAAGWNRGWLIGWRDICRATDERTVIASVLPISGVGNKVPLLLPDQASPQHAACLLANLNALVQDFAARQKIGGITLNFFIAKQLAVLDPHRYTAADTGFIVPRVLELTYTTPDLSPWARDLGYHGDPFLWNIDRRKVLRSELDAYYAHLYKITREDLNYILDPTSVMGPEYPTETFRVLKYNDERQFKTFRTRDLVLDAWDRLFGASASALRVALTHPRTADVF
jgi:hypothetical protein